MFLQKRLACSFCGKNAAEVSKLVAGPKVYICDACVALASRIIDDSAGATPQRPSASRTGPIGTSDCAATDPVTRWAFRPISGQAGIAMRSPSRTIRAPSAPRALDTCSDELPSSL